MKHRLLHYSAFTNDTSGGNPAGIWIGDSLPAQKEMQEIAKEVGYSETAFLAPATGLARTVRYFSPAMEVSFCGHATIASGVALGNTQGPGLYLFSTLIGEIPVTVTTQNGGIRASLTSVEPRKEAAPENLIQSVLDALRWSRSDLDPNLLPALAYAGAWHLVLAVGTVERLNDLDYDFEELKSVMTDAKLVTIQIVWRESDHVFHSRNPFPVGGVWEDPATGAAAAALGGYLREMGLIEAPAKILIHQGVAMGRPSKLEVCIPVTGGILVSGMAVEILVDTN